MRALYIAMRCDHILKEGEWHGTICNSPHFRCYRRYNRVYSCIYNCESILWYLNRSLLASFGYYRIIVAILAIIYLYMWVYTWVPMRQKWSWKNSKKILASEKLSWYIDIALRVTEKNEQNFQKSFKKFLTLSVADVTIHLVVMMLA